MNPTSALQMSVGELAERVAFPGDDLASLIARLRNWTKEGLLKTQGDANPGRGRSRFYGEEAIGHARALRLLADVVGMPAVSSKAWRAFYDEAHKALTERSAAHRFLVIEKSLDGTGTIRSLGTTKREALDQYLARSECATHIVIDLNKFFDQIGE